MPTPGRLKHKWMQLWLRRLPVSDSLTFGHRNLYILPTPAGWMLGLTLVVLLLGSINYMLNLGYLLTFLLAGVAVVAMHKTHQNLRGLQIQAAAGDAVFAGQARAVQVVLHNPSTAARYGVQVYSLEARKSQTAVWADVPPQNQVRLALPQGPNTRGCHPIEPFGVGSRFPLGTFKSWAWCRPAGLQVVYPAPEQPCPPFPIVQLETDRPTAGSVHRADPADQLRPYRAGDPLKRVYWKKVAKTDGDGTDGWISREQALGQAGELWLDLERCGLSDPEARLSRLCAWVLEAERLQLRYGLNLPSTRLAPNTGPRHQKSCLEALALC
ncbi:MAG: hypothetical protein RL323_1051 [Pseudomonadota bacterium]